MSLIEDGFVLLEYFFSMAVPIWKHRPTRADYGNVYSDVSTALELQQDSYDETQDVYHMARGSELSVNIMNRIEFTRMFVESSPFKAHRISDLTDQALTVVSSCRRHLPLVLLAQPTIRLRAIWPLQNPPSAYEFLAEHVNGNIHPEALRKSLRFGLHLIDVSSNPLEGGIADVKVEPFVRDPSNLWIEVVLTDPSFTLLGLGVRAFGSPATSDGEVDRIQQFASEAHRMLSSLPTLFTGRIS